MKQIKKIAITNEKGGVGKTMTAVNLSACLAQRGYRVLLIDADPQGYATLNYDVDVSPSLLEVLRGQVACTKAVQTTRFGVDVLPSDRTLSVIEEDLIRQKMNGAPYLNTLEKALEDLPDYDFVIIDCPPQGGRLMDIVHYYADAIIMPMFAEDYGIHALTLKAEAIADIRRTINPNLKILGGLITMDERRGLRSVFREVLLGQDLLPMFNTTIRRNVALIRAVNFRADQVRRMSETELALIRAERSAKDAAKRAKERAVALAEQEAQRKRENLNIYRQKCAAICATVSKRPTNLKLVFDLETTGLNFAEDEILEAAITTVDGEVLFESRFKPAYTKEWSGAQRVNGISPEDVEDAPGIIDKIGEMAALLQNAETVIAYNGKQFDIPFLERYGIRLRPDAVIDDPMLYGAVVYGELRGEGEDVNYKWKKLAVLADYLGYKGANWHSAAADCIATAYVWRQLQESDMIEKYNENLAKLNEVSEETDTSF